MALMLSVTIKSIMLNAIILNVTISSIILNVIILSINMLNVIMQNVVMPMPSSVFFVIEAYLGQRPSVMHIVSVNKILVRY